MASKSGDLHEHDGSGQGEELSSERGNDRHAAGERPDRRGSDEAAAFARLTRLHHDVHRAEEEEPEEEALADEGEEAEDRLQADRDEASAPPPG